eukprot:CAMPEP_0172435242 /NCGR_PEP_ID=MMETSP1064-20121228/71071_1 /TAXON_ID=202472 /ORGANISM="Aulacoseira subarctica , Strain CCAP 1002/5" /LENGTH=638 /DNA_ID=CAMNT_0013183535 /DNA_START=231 /DNA_END=2147 /DNA_ORIENTATION=-
METATEVSEIPLANRSSFSPNSSSADVTDNNGEQHKSSMSPGNSGFGGCPEKSEDPVISTNSRGCPFSSTSDTRSSCPFSQTTAAVKGETTNSSFSGSNNFTRSNGGCPVLGKSHSSFAESWAYLLETVEREFPAKSSDVVTTADQLEQFIEQARISSAAVLPPYKKRLPDDVSDDVPADYPKEEILEPKNESKEDTITEQVGLKRSSCPFSNNQKNNQATMKGCPFSSQKQETATTNNDSSSSSSAVPKDVLTTRQGGCPVMGKPHSSFAESWAYLQETVQREFPPKSSDVITTADQLLQFIEQARISSVVVLHPNNKRLPEDDVSDDVPADDYPKEEIVPPKDSESKEDTTITEQAGLQSSACPFSNNHKSTNGLSCPFANKQVTRKGCPFSSQKQETATTNNDSSSISSVVPKEVLTTRQGGCPVIGKSHSNFSESWAYLQETVERDFPTKSSNIISTAEQLQQFIEQSRMLPSNYKEQGEIIFDEQIPERNVSSRLVSRTPEANHQRQEKQSDHSRSNAQQTDTNGLLCPFSKKRVDDAKGSASCPFSNTFANPASGCPVLTGQKHTNVADALAHLRQTVELNCTNVVSSSSDHISTAEQLQAALAFVNSENISKEESDSFSFSPFGHRQEELD